MWLGYSNFALRRRWLQVHPVSWLLNSDKQMKCTSHTVQWKWSSDSQNIWGKWLQDSFWYWPWTWRLTFALSSYVLSSVLGYIYASCRNKVVRFDRTGNQSQMFIPEFFPAFYSLWSAIGHMEWRNSTLYGTGWYYDTVRRYSSTGTFMNDFTSTNYEFPRFRIVSQLPTKVFLKEELRFQEIHTLSATPCQVKQPVCMKCTASVVISMLVAALDNSLRRIQWCMDFQIWCLELPWTTFWFGNRSHWSHPLHSLSLQRFHL